jgi:hypothetical protein
MPVSSECCDLSLAPTFADCGRRRCPSLPVSRCGMPLPLRKPCAEAGRCAAPDAASVANRSSLSTADCSCGAAGGNGSICRCRNMLSVSMSVSRSVNRSGTTLSGTTTKAVDDEDLSPPSPPPAPSIAPGSASDCSCNNRGAVVASAASRPFKPTRPLLPTAFRRCGTVNRVCCGNADASAGASRCHSDDGLYWRGGGGGVGHGSTSNGK